MGLLEDAALLLAGPPPQTWDVFASRYRCAHCDAAVGDASGHDDDCPVLAMPRIVAALEMLGPMVDLVERMGRHHYPGGEHPMGPYAPPGSPPTYRTCEHYCSSWPCVESEVYEAVMALVAALRGEAPNT